jgi:SWI/SNF-related matrix-associated actin-dependent regulator of chromatin subfamily A3
MSKNKELLKKLASLVEDGEDFGRPIFISPPCKTCQTCIIKILKSSSSLCPICRWSLSKDEDGSDNLGSDKPLSAEGRPFIKVRGLFTVQKDIAFAGRASE